MSAEFDDDTLIGYAGLVPLLGLAQRAGLAGLCHDMLTVPSGRGNNHAGANTAGKVATLIAGMAAGADSIEDMDLLRHGGMGAVFDGVSAPSTLGTFLRGASWGTPAQFAALARAFTTGLARHAPMLANRAGMLFIDIDDKVTEVYGPAKHGAAFGYRGIRGLNSMIAVAATDRRRPVIIGQRLRRGSATSGTGARSFVADALAAATGTGHTGPIMVRLDSGFYSAAVVAAVRAAGAHVSVGVRQFRWVRELIAGIEETAWQPYDYAGATPSSRDDRGAHTVLTDAAAADIPYEAFGSHPRDLRVPGRLIITRRPVRHPDTDEQHTLFPTYRYHAFFTTQPASDIDTVTAVYQHHRHAIVEQIHADLHAGPLAHWPSGDFVANHIWLHLAAMTYNLLRAAASLTHTLTTATSATLRRTLIAVPARLAHRARRLIVHLPRHWHHQHDWHTLTGTPARH